MLAGTISLRPRRRLAALVLSAVAHAVLLGIIAWRLGITPTAPEPRIVQVQLVPALRPVRPPRSEPDRDRPPPKRRVAPVWGPTPRRVEASPQIAPAPVTGGASFGDDTGGRVLRGLLACDPAALPRLTGEARRRCEARLAGDLSGPPGPRLNLDREGRFAEDETPVLIRKPKDGCRLRMAGDKPRPSGEQKGVTAGVGCAWSF